MKQLQATYNNLLNRMQSDQNKKKYNAINLNSLDTEEHQKISDCISHVKSLLETIPTISDLQMQNFHKNTCMTYLKKLENLLDEYGW